MMPADCSLDFECISSPQTPAVTTESYQTSHGVIGVKHRDCTRIRTGTDICMEARKCQ